MNIESKIATNKISSTNPRGAGRKSIKDEREIRESLQKFLPDVEKYFKAVFALSDSLVSMKVKGDAVKMVLAKLVADKSPSYGEFGDRLEDLENRLGEVLNKIRNEGRTN